MIAPVAATHSAIMAPLWISRHAHVNARLTKPEAVIVNAIPVTQGLIVQHTNKLIKNCERLIHSVTIFVIKFSSDICC